MTRLEKIFSIIICVCVISIGTLAYLLNEVNNSVKQVESIAVQALALGFKNAPRPKLTYDSTDVVFGDTAAKVKIYMFSKSDCSHCQEFLRITFPQIKNHYIDSNKVCFILKHVSLVSAPISHYAARAGLCLGEQNLQEFYLTALDSGTVDDSIKLKAQLTQMKVDTGKYANCMMKENTWKHVASDRALAKGLQVAGTPTFFINDSMVAGAHSFLYFKQIIDTKINK